MPPACPEYIQVRSAEAAWRSQHAPDEALHVILLIECNALQGEVDDMRDSMEGLLYQHGVDAVFTGHVHAYERISRYIRIPLFSDNSGLPNASVAAHACAHPLSLDACSPPWGLGGGNQGPEVTEYQHPNACPRAPPRRRGQVAMRMCLVHT